MFCVISRIIISVKMGMFFQDITSIAEFPGSNFLLPTIQVANLLLATVNFEPWHISQLVMQTLFHKERVENFRRFAQEKLLQPASCLSTKPDHVHNSLPVSNLPN